MYLTVMGTQVPYGIVQYCTGNKV